MRSLLFLLFAACTPPKDGADSGAGPDTNSSNGADDGGSDGAGADGSGADGSSGSDGSDGSGTDGSGTDGGSDGGTSLHGTPPDSPVAAPDFTATNRDGSSRNRDFLLTHPPVMWFYPAAGTSG
jgi:hypothetical protein